MEITQTHSLLLATVTIDVCQVVGLRRPSVFQLGWLHVHMTVHAHGAFVWVAAELSSRHFRQC